MTGLGTDTFIFKALKFSARTGASLLTLTRSY